MQVKVDPSYPFPVFFMLSSRASALAAPPAQAVAVLIVKQTILSNGTIPPKEQQQGVLLTDEPIDPAGADPNNDLATFLEADLASYKPVLDVVATRNNPLRGLFGRIRIDRNDGNGFQPNPGLAVDWGWQSRVLGNDPPGGAVNPRKAQAGNAAAFLPDVNDPTKLPNGFENAFFNGGRVRTLNHLSPGQRVEFDLATRRVTVPAGPTLAITVAGAPIEPPVAISLAADTVVWNETAQHFMVTWRAVFPWEHRLGSATMEVS
jgi:hypothetical protein